MRDREKRKNVKLNYGCNVKKDVNTQIENPHDDDEGKEERIMRDQQLNNEKRAWDLCECHYNHL